MTHPTYHATKYDSARDEVIALLADEAEGYGMRDDTYGDVTDYGTYGALVTIPADVTFPSAPFDAYSYGADTVANEYGVTPADVAGTHIVTHNSQGFVSVETFDSEQEARAEYDQRADAYAEWDDDTAIGCGFCESGEPMIHQHETSV
jgi:FAD/FMN-containing dehydrogenase